MNKKIAIASLCLTLFWCSYTSSAQDSKTINTLDADKLLLDATFNNNYNKTLNALKQHANVNSKNNTGETALAWSVYNGNLKLAQLLVEKGADVHVKISNNRTLLHFALSPQVREGVLSSHKKRSKTSLAQRCLMIEFLLDKGVDPTLEDDSGTLPVHVAAGGLRGEYRDHIKLITLLLPDKTLLQHKNQYGFTPIDMAKDPKIKAYLRSLVDE